MKKQSANIYCNNNIRNNPDITINNLIFSSSEYNKDRSCFDNVNYLIFNIKPLEFITDFIKNEAIVSKNNLNELLNIKLSDSIFFDYMINYFKEWCINLYDDHEYFFRKGYKLIIYQHFRELIDKIEKLIGRDKLNELFNDELKKRNALLSPSLFSGYRL